MTSGVHILLPGLFDLPLEELDAEFINRKLPCLNRILGRASTRENSDYSLDDLIANALGMRQPGRSAGLAMASAFAPDDEVPERLMLVEAIHLQADLHGAVAVPIAKTQENIHDIGIIINDLKDLFNVDCDITSIADGLYLLRLRDFDPPTHYPHPLSILGKRIDRFIEQSREVLPWYRLINEFQMFMHQHPQNAQRQLRGALSINSLWAWGAGPRPVPGAQAAWYCDDELLNRFAGKLGLSVASPAKLQQADALDAAVIVDLRLLQLLKSGSDSQLDDLLLDIEQQLLAPVVKILQRRPAPLRLRGGYRVDFELKPGARFKFWRRPGSLLHWRQ